MYQKVDSIAKVHVDPEFFVRLCWKVSHKLICLVVACKNYRPTKRFPRKSFPLWFQVYPKGVVMVYYLNMLSLSGSAYIRSSQQNKLMVLGPRLIGSFYMWKVRCGTIKIPALTFR